MDHTNYDYSTLPSHIIAKILTKLRIEEFRNASLACKSWYYASSDPRVTKHIRVTFDLDATNCDHLARSIQNLMFANVNWNKLHYRMVLQKFGSTIVDLKIRPSITETRLFELFVYLPNLRTLIINDTLKWTSAENLRRSKKFIKYNDVIVKNLLKLRKVHISTELRDLQFYQLFLSYCKNMTEFCWRALNSLEHDDDDFIFKFILNKNENTALYKIVALGLESLHQNRNTQFFEKMIELKLPNIRMLSLNKVSTTFYNIAFKEFCKTYNYLDSLSLNGCNDQHLADICKYMKNLKYLILNNCTANHLSQLVNLNYLEKLDIHHGIDILQNDIEVLMSKDHTFLKNLSLNHIDSSILKLLCEHCKNLEKLYISNLSTQDCEPIFRHLIKLKSLRLLFTDPPTMHSSRIKSCDHFNITNLTELEELHISCYVPGITPDLIEKLPKIRRINDYIRDPTDDELANDNNQIVPNVENDYIPDNDNGTNSEMENVVTYDISDFNFCLDLNK